MRVFIASLVAFAVGLGAGVLLNRRPAPPLVSWPFGDWCCATDTEWHKDCPPCFYDPTAAWPVLKPNHVKGQRHPKHQLTSDGFRGAHPSPTEAK